MARIRTIKPEHWEDEDWNNVSIQAHLLWIGMKNFADDQGVIKDNVVLIKNKVFPTREDIRTSEVLKWIKELIENCFLVPFQFENKGYYVLDFSNERIDKPQPSIVPESAFKHLLYRKFNNNQEDSIPFENIPAVEESKVKESKVKERECKEKVLDYVSLTFIEIEKLKNEFNEDGYSWLINKLNSYKGSKGKKYKSDYMAIHQWVVSAYREEKEKSSGQKEKLSKIETNMNSVNEAKGYLKQMRENEQRN